jgi:hypothetical protein
MCGVGEVVDDEPRDVPRHPDARCRRRSRRGAARRGVVDDEPARGEVVDDESRDKPRNVPKQPDKNTKGAF